MGASDGRVIGIVVQDSMATSSSDPTIAAAGRKAEERYPTLKAAWDECLDLLSCAPAESNQQQAVSSDDDLPDPVAVGSWNREPCVRDGISSSSTGNDRSVTARTRR